MAVVLVTVSIAARVLMTMSVVPVLTLMPVIATLVLPLVIIVALPATFVAAVVAYYFRIAQVGPIDVEADVDAANLDVALQRGGQTDAGLPTRSPEPEPHPCVRRVINLGRWVVDILVVGAPAMRGSPRWWIRQGWYGYQCSAGHSEQGHHGNAVNVHDRVLHTGQNDGTPMQLRASGVMRRRSLPVQGGNHASSPIAIQCIFTARPMPRCAVLGALPLENAALAPPNTNE